MTDTTNPSPNKVFPKLRDSKIYQVARSHHLLNFMVPDLPVQISVGTDIETNFPRKDTDQDATRILINYTNSRGNSSLTQLNDPLRLDRPIDLDNFLDGFSDTLDLSEISDTIEDQTNAILLPALNMAAFTAMGLAGEDMQKEAKDNAAQLLPALISIIFDDPLDVVIALRDPAANDEMGGEPVISAVWATKPRNAEA